MKNSDEAIEKVLAGLRDSEPRPEMERRILEALQDHASSQSRSGWRRLTLIWTVTMARPRATRSLAFGGAVGSVFASVLLVSGLVISATHGPKSRVGHAPAQPMDAARIEPLVAAASPADLQAAANRAEYARPEPSRRSKGKPIAREAVFIGASDSVALLEMRAPSLPAPPMPLTGQEKLLLRIAHQNDPVEVAMLEPGMPARLEAEGDAEFKRFFDPPSTKSSKSEAVAAQDDAATVREEPAPAKKDSASADEEPSPMKQTSGPAEQNPASTNEQGDGR